MARSGPVRRPYRPRERKKRFLLCCEGEETEPTYFRGLRHFLRSQLIDLEIPRQQGDPKGLVELAKAKRDEAERIAKAEGDDSLLYDEVWCVFDVDTHARLRPAIQQAIANSISLAVSNPCFELWLLVHFKKQWGYITCADATSGVKDYISRYDKKVDYSWLVGKGAAALSRAEAMERNARRNRNKLANPTTGVWRLVAELCKHANFPSSDL
jgi:hypothetical protein